MLLRIRGKAHNIVEPLVGKITRNINENLESRFLIYGGNDESPFKSSRFEAVLTDKELLPSNFSGRAIYNVPGFSHLNEGDIVSLSSKGYINTLYRVDSFHNTILATERCNSNCLMCSQPPKNRDDIDYHFNIHQKLIPLIPENCPELGVSGGEPTLMGDKFFQLLKLIEKELPRTEVHVLTNGRSFAWSGFAQNFSSFNTERIMLGIPLYSDYYQLHDYVVQASNAFNQTMLGLYNLARFDQRIEIRVVLHKITIPRLLKLAKFIYKNLPFVQHVAFMGLEYTGYTPHNIKKLWIDPVDYTEELSKAVHFLDSQGMNVSIYNLQLCLLPKDLWKFCRKSISDWKNIYLEECLNCSVMDECAGLFASCKEKHSKYIKAMA